MINYIKGELFRISKMTVFRVMCLLILMTESFFFWVVYHVEDFRATLSEGWIIPLFISFVSGAAPFILLFFVSCFHSDEIKKKTVNRAVEASHGRGKIFAGKTIGVYFISFMTILGTFLYALCITKIFFPPGSIHWGNIIYILKYFGLKILVLTTFQAFLGLLYSKITKEMFIVITYMVSLKLHSFLNLIFKLLHWDVLVKYTRYLPSALLQDLDSIMVIKMILPEEFKDGLMPLTFESLSLRLGVLLIFTLLLTGIGYKIYLKKDFT